MPAEASRSEAKASASLAVNSLLPRSLPASCALASTPPAFSASRFSLTHRARAAMASRVPESSKLTSPAGVTTASVWPPRMASTTGSALSSGTRMPCASTTLAVAGDRRERVDRERHRLLDTDLQIPFVVGEHEAPAEIAADDEGERDAVGIVRGHGAVAEGAVVVAVGLALPAARGEGLRRRRGEQRPRRRETRQSPGLSTTSWHPRPG